MEKRRFDIVRSIFLPKKKSTLGFCRLLKNRSLKKMGKKQPHTLSTR